MNNLANSRRMVARSVCPASSATPWKASRRGCVDDRRLDALQEMARGAGYIPIVTDIPDILQRLLVSKDIALVMVDMRHCRSRCALWQLLKWAFPRIPLVLSATATDCLVCISCPAPCHRVTA